MSIRAVTYTFNPTDAGGYDYTGIYYPPATAVVTSGFTTEDVFVTFDSGAIASTVASLTGVKIVFNFTASNDDYIQSQPILVLPFQFQSQEDQDYIESNRTNPAGPTPQGTANADEIAAYNFIYLDHNGLYFPFDQVNVRGGSVSNSDDVTTLLSGLDANDFDFGFAFSNGAYDEGDPVFGLSKYAGLTKITNTSITVTGLQYYNLPIILGTVSNQADLDDIAIRPFSNVAVLDPSNPNGFGDTIVIVITDATGAATDALGTLTLPNSSNLRYLSPGTYRLSSDSFGGVVGIGSLKAAMQALVFSPASLGDGGAPATANFTLNYRAIDGTPATDTTTSVIIKHDLRAITLTGQATGRDDKPFTALKGFTVVDPYPGDQVGATIFVQAGTGKLSGTGLTQNTDGSYTLAASSVDVLNHNLQTLLFTPTPGLAAGGATSTAEITIFASANDGWTQQGAESVKVTAAFVAPVIGGATADRLKAGDTDRPFRQVVLTDGNANSTDTLKIQLSNAGAGGTLSGAGLTGGPGGSYVLSGTAADITRALQALVFTPTAGAPNSSVTTTFTLDDRTSPGTSATNANFSVTIDTAAVNPALSGSAALTVQNETAATPFANVVLSDPNLNSTDTLTIQLSNAGRDGTLSGTGLGGGAGGVYTLSGTGVQVTAALQALVFKPAPGVPGSSTTTTFKLVDKATAGTGVSSSAFSVTNVDGVVAPVLTGSAAIKVQSEAASKPFATATLSDPNLNSSDTLAIQLSNGGNGGTLSGNGLVSASGGLYRLTGTPAVVTAALQALVFTPTKGAAGTSATTSFTLTDTTTAGTASSLAGFSVTNTDPLFATGAVFNPGPVNNATIDATSPGSHTVIIGAGNQNTITYGPSSGTVSGTGSGNTVTGGNGVITVSGLGGGTTVVLGDGNNTVNLAAAGAGNSIVVGNGNNRIAAGNGGGEQVTAGNGANTISAGGNGDIVTAGNGANSVTMTGAGALVTTGSGGDTISIVGVGGATIRAGLGTNKISFAGTGNVVVNQGGNDMVTDSGFGNTLVTSLAGSGVITVGANALSNGDVFDLRATMAATGWNHMSGTLGSYLSTGLQGNDATIVVRPTGSAPGASFTVAVLTGAGPTSLSTLLPTP